MKKLFKNKIFLIVLTLIVGFAVGWLLKPSNDQTISSSENQASENQVFTCSMHPQIRQAEPGDCPICGMDLIPLSESENEDADPMAVSMSSTAMKLADVRTAKVGTLKPIKVLNLNGKIQADERLVYSQTSHFPGRIERLTVNFTGEYVTKGSPVAYLYSPKLVTAQEELFQARKMEESQPELYQAAREKLKNWKLTEAQIDEILESEKAREEFPVNSDYSGFVLDKTVNLGDYVKEGETLYKIADLSQVWAMLDVYESDLAWIEEGDSVTFTVASLPGKTYSGKIDFIDPLINPQSRVAKARVVVNNPNRKLKPEMFASATVEAKIKEGSNQMVIPKSAVMWTGKRSVVYVKSISDSGLDFKMREVVLGPSLEDSYIVESGLESGEEIAVSGTFSIDAAAQLAGKPSMMAPEGGATMTGHNHGGSPANERSGKPGQSNSEVNKMEKTMEVPSAFTDQVKAIFNEYILLKDHLVESDAAASAEAATQLKDVLEKVDMSLIEGEAHRTWMTDLRILEEKTASIAAEENLENQRKLFPLLSDQLYHTLMKFQVDVTAFRQYCPMAMDNEGAYWLSTSKEIRNPYFGDQMLTCGSVKEEL